MEMAQHELGYLQATVYGIVQGLTEFLPISSTAHLRVLPSIMGWHDPGVAYTAVIQLGSLIAILAYFAKDLYAISGGFVLALCKKDWTNSDLRLVLALVIGTLPICVFGLAFKDLLEAPHGPFRSLPVIAIASILMAILLFGAERYGKRTRAIGQVKFRDGLVIGLGQSLALIAGCSRSGSTLSFAMLSGFRREDAARFGFLLGIPAILLSGLLELRTLLTGPTVVANASLIVGLAAATISSYLSIWWMLDFLKTHTTGLFIFYRLVFGVVLLVCVHLGVLN